MQRKIKKIKKFGPRPERCGFEAQCQERPASLRAVTVLSGLQPKLGPERRWMAL